MCEGDPFTDEVGVCVKVTLMRWVYVWEVPTKAYHIYMCRNIILTTHAQKTVMCYFLCMCN